MTTQTHSDFMALEGHCRASCGP